MYDSLMTTISTIMLTLVLILFHFEILISEANTFVENYDQRILNELKHPISINGAHLYQSMLQYYSNLLDILNMLKNGNLKVRDYVSGIVKDGGLKLLKYNYNMTKLALTFGWGGYQTEDFKTVFIGIKHLWNNITEAMYSESSENSDTRYSYSSSSSEMEDLM
jgi:hypothetical protein